MFLQHTLPVLLFIASAFAWLFVRQEKLFDKIEAIGNRINRLEEKFLSIEKRLEEKFFSIDKGC